MDANNNARHVDYRPMRWEDLDAVAACFDRVWPQREGIAGTPLAPLIARYLTLHYLEASTSSDLAETDDGVFAGITLARVAGAPTLFAQAHDELERVRALIVADPRGAAVVTMFEDGFFVRERILEEDADVDETTQAELELFMVSPDARGIGVGGALWRRLLAHLRADGVRAFFLHTDSSCDYGFYDHKGLTRAAERIAADLADTALAGAVDPNEGAEVRGA